MTASRGRLTPYASFRSADTWIRIVVSERSSVAPSDSRSLRSPSRESEPMTRMLSGPRSPSYSGFAALCVIASPLAMLPLSRS